MKLGTKIEMLEKFSSHGSKVMVDFDHKIIFDHIFSCIEKCDCIDWCFCEKDVVKECGFSNDSGDWIQTEDKFYTQILKQNKFIIF
jgi:hypothetical protein